MKWKYNPIGEIGKWKSRLCVGGHRSVKLIYYWDTYFPVVLWQTTRLAFTLIIASNWFIHSIDFVMAFPQVNIKTNIYVHPPQVPNSFKIPDLSSFIGRFTRMYKLIKNVYGLKDVGFTWNNHLKKGLLARGWTPSLIEECIFVKQGLFLIMYVDDACIIFPRQSSIY